MNLFTLTVPGDWWISCGSGWCSREHWIEPSCRSEVVAPSPTLNPGLVMSNRFFLFLRKRQEWEATPVHSLCLGQEFGSSERLGREPEPQRWSWGRLRRGGPGQGG